MKVKEEAYEKAVEKRELERKFFFCLANQICPECGGSLTITEVDVGRWDIHKCNSCSFIFKGI